MSIDSLEAWRFRNFEQFQLRPDPHLNVIYGDNGSGKTSLIEAIYTLARLRSFRTSDVKQLIATGKEDCLCVAKICDANDRLHNLGIQRTKNSLLVKLDGEPLRRSSELATLLPLQIINNDVHLLIEGGPSQRRQFLDWGVFHVEPVYGETMKQFRHILKQRNAALKKHWTAQQVRLWDEQLIETSEQIQRMRAVYIESLNVTLETLLADSFNLPSFTMHYHQGWEKQTSYAEVLKETLENDFRLGKTHYGPHRADLRLRSQGQALKEVVSRGQQKILATMMMLAQIEFFKQQTGRTLVLLIDDLPAELDRHFSSYFLQKVLDTNSQIFVTSTDYRSMGFSQTSINGKMFHVEHGKITETESSVFSNK